MSCESLGTQEPQCECAAVSHGVSGEIPKGSVYGRSQPRTQGNLPRNRRAVRGRVSGDRRGSRPGAFSSAGSADVESNEAYNDDQEFNSQRDSQAPPECEEAVMGRRVMVERLLHHDGRQAWQ
jgi:hypothetical protein